MKRVLNLEFFVFNNFIDESIFKNILSSILSIFYRCHIVDFHKATGPLGTHPRLFEWILNYYSSEREGGPKVVCTSKPPIYLQHQG